MFLSPVYCPTVPGPVRCFFHLYTVPGPVRCFFHQSFTCILSHCSWSCEMFLSSVFHLYTVPLFLVLWDVSFISLSPVYCPTVPGPMRCFFHQSFTCILSHCSWSCEMFLSPVYCPSHPGPVRCFFHLCTVPLTLVLWDVSFINLSSVYYPTVPGPVRCFFHLYTVHLSLVLQDVSFISLSSVYCPSVPGPVRCFFHQSFHLYTVPLFLVLWDLSFVSLSPVYCPTVPDPVRCFFHQSGTCILFDCSWSYEMFLSSIFHLYTVPLFLIMWDVSFFSLSSVYCPTVPGHGKSFFQQSFTCILPYCFWFCKMSLSPVYCPNGSGPLRCFFHQSFTCVLSHCSWSCKMFLSSVFHLYTVPPLFLVLWDVSFINLSPVYCPSVPGPVRCFFHQSFTCILSLCSWSYEMFLLSVFHLYTVLLFLVLWDVSFICILFFYSWSCEMFFSHVYRLTVPGHVRCFFHQPVTCILFHCSRSCKLFSLSVFSLFCVVLVTVGGCVGKTSYQRVKTRKGFQKCPTVLLLFSFS